MTASRTEPRARCRIVLTGGPGGGKTTAADLFRRELGDRVAVVPESATILFGGGFPRPDQPDRAMGTSLEQELLRYDAVVFFETAAVAGLSIEGGNPVHKETLKQARHLDAELRQLWVQHPRFLFVPHDQSFFHKITVGLSLLQAVSEELLQ